MKKLQSQAQTNSGAHQPWAMPQGSSSARAPLEERPCLASYVRLLGEMAGTGFAERQWLIGCADRFLQVSELLYRVAEHADGRHTPEEIAQQVTARTEWLVTAEDVHHLMYTKLLPLGLLATEQAGATPQADMPEAPRPRSPLAVNLRVRLLSPRLIEPVTQVLQFLYAPSLLFSLLVVAGMAHWWLYHDHGVTNSVASAVNTPGGLLLVFALVIVAGMFHGFGHAAALRYGGGQVRSMGMGFYLIYPTLYTDVTDSYRLSRWARVRTDLGGVYFHLLFAAALIMAPFETGKELLLFAALLINLEMLRQLLPFVRLDGYWVLADLTGIPDFFSQLGPFVRSVFGVSGPKLPPLKPWVAAVFALYGIVTVPLLTYLFARLIFRLPQMVGITWEAALKQYDLLLLAAHQGHMSMIVLIGTQILLLGVPTFGAVYLLISVIRMASTAAGSWRRGLAGAALSPWDASV